MDIPSGIWPSSISRTADPRQVTRMKLHPFKVLALGVLLAAVAGNSIAAAAQQPEAPQSVGEILQFQHALRTKLETPTGEYSRFDGNAIQRMERAQDKIFHMLAGVTSLDQLNADQKVDISNSLDEVKAVLLANDGNRMICHREHKIGSNLTERRCETVAAREVRIHDAFIQMSHEPLHGTH